MERTTNKQQLLDKLQDQILMDNPCQNLAVQATQLVFGAGNPNADIVFIGEAPGKNEDIQGKPFVGAAGKFLDEMLESVALNRKDVYITNIVKYRPPNNRDPLPEEKKAFVPYLLSQLNIIQPKLVVTLGRHSMETFLPGFRISQIHGQPKRIHWNLYNNRGRDFTDDSEINFAQVDNNEEPVSQAKSIVSEFHKQEIRPAMTLVGTNDLPSRQVEQTWVILPLFHPAAALYNGSMRQTLIADFARLPLVLKKL